jgi:GDP-mannose pyrophosphatase NudK
MKEININSRALLSDKAYRLEEISFTKFGIDGDKHEQTHEVYYRPDAVSVLLVDRENEEFILAQQLRLPVFLNPHGSTDGYLLEACAGLIEEGEQPEQAVIREAREETGYRVANPVKIGGIYTSAGGITEFLHLFIAEVEQADHQDEGGGAEGEGEDIELVRLKFSEAKQRLEKGEINDAKTMLLLQHYFLHYQ